MTDLTQLMLDDPTAVSSSGVPLRRDQKMTATLDLTEAALLEPDPAAERARLKSRGFARARISEWRAGDVALSITLYELASEQQAELAVQDMTETMRAAGATLGMVQGLSGASLEDGGHTTILVTGHAGPFHVVVLMTGAPVAVAGAVANAQLARITATLS